MSSMSFKFSDQRTSDTRIGETPYPCNISENNVLKGPEDPARGEFTFGIDPHGYPQLLLKKGNRTVFRGGPWTGIKFTSNPRPIPNQISTNEFVLNNQEVYFEYRIQSSVSSKLTLSPLGLAQSLTWNDRAQDWVIVENGQHDQCEECKCEEKELEYEVESRNNCQRRCIGRGHAVGRDDVLQAEEESWEE
ncbi:hypothetical protein D5086_003569 [Populus alba]|uniref:Uncharacterized protein n=1 Tax=Populus alba TaxID=43335 RepID=A0ACC4D685_POPAL